MRDDFDSVVADRFKVLDQVPVPDTWSRVQLKVLDHMPNPDTPSRFQFTEEVVTMIDVKTTDPTEPRRKRPMRVVVAGVLAAAAVVAIVFVATSDVDVVTPTDDPSTTVPPTPPPQALFGTPPGEQLEPGTYFVDEVDRKADGADLVHHRRRVVEPTTVSGIRQADTGSDPVQPTRTPCSRTPATRPTGITRGP